MSFWHPSHVFDVDERRRLEQLDLASTLVEIRTALDEGLKPLEKTELITVPCGGGVDSSLLGAYLASRSQKVEFLCINQPDAPRRESEWMEPLSKQLNIPVRYANIDRAKFLDGLITALQQSKQPLIGPNFVSGRIARRVVHDESGGNPELVSGELCDTVFGGLSMFYHLSWKFRALRQLARLPRRQRLWTTRAVASLPAWLNTGSQVVQDDALARIGSGHLERADVLAETELMSYPGQSVAQNMADRLTWVQMKDVPSVLNTGFFEFDEWCRTTQQYPFASPKMLRLGLHLPQQMKRRQGFNKWIWRTFAETYIGHQVAFRPKYAFPTLTDQWLDRVAPLIQGGYLEDLLTAKVGVLYATLPKGDPSRWTLANLELWGRLHILGESPECLKDALL